MLHKLKSYGICGDLLQWLSTFMRNRDYKCVTKNDYDYWYHKAP